MSQPKESSELPSLSALVGHREFVRADETMEAVHQHFAGSRHDFLAVLDGRTLLGLCARRDLGTLMGARYGFALFARAAVRDHLSKDGIRLAVDEPLTEVLQKVAARRDEHFYDDVLLVDAAGDFLGLIYVRDLVRLQTGMLLDNIVELQAKQEEINRRNREMEEDLRMAREVQLAMLPAQFGGGTGPLEFAHLYRPAGGVSGDFFDVLAMEEGVAAVIICDVMGHGVRAALVTAMVRAMIEELRGHAVAPGTLLTQLNMQLTRLLQRTGDMIFVTAACGVVDAPARRFTYAQAGHPPPLHWCAATGAAAPVVAGRVAGPALGLLGYFTYVAVEFPAEPGDRLLFFTDGIVEADDAGEEFGVARLSAALAAQAGTDLQAALGKIESAAAAFAGHKPFADDVCLVACAIAR